MTLSPDDARIAAIFKTIAVPNQARSVEEGRPIFDDMEVVEIRFAGDASRVSVFPALEFAGNVTLADGTTQAMSYAERFPAQYAQFKKGQSQTKSGTPLEELTFLTQSQRASMKALNIYTAETLADLDGPALKTLGMDGRSLKDQARAYLDRAAGASETSRLAAENEALRAQLAALQGATKDVEPEKGEPSEFADWTDDDLKAWIKAESGQAPRGNPSHETLVRMADELTASKDSGKA